MAFYVSWESLAGTDTDVGSHPSRCLERKAMSLYSLFCTVLSAKTISWIFFLNVQNPVEPVLRPLFILAEWTLVLPTWKATSRSHWKDKVCVFSTGVSEGERTSLGATASGRKYPEPRAWPSSPSLYSSEPNSLACHLPQGIIAYCKARLHHAPAGQLQSRQQVPKI